jgi:hypothetical protein
MPPKLDILKTPTAYRSPASKQPPPPLQPTCPPYSAPSATCAASASRSVPRQSDPSTPLTAPRLQEYGHQMHYIGDTKAGTLIGTDRFGNKYYENLAEELPRTPRRPPPPPRRR